MKKILYILILTLLVSCVPVNAYAKANQTPEGYYKIAEDLYNTGKYQEAINNYDLAIKLNSKYVAAYIGKGNALSGLIKYTEAVGSFDAAAKLNPKDPQPYFYKGRVLYLQAKFDEALKSYDTASQLGLNSAELFFERGKVLSALNKNEDAIAAYDKAIQINSKYAQAYLNKGDILYNQKKYDEALQLYNTVIGIDPKNPVAYYDKGSALLFLRKYEDSIKANDVAISLDPSFEAPYVCKADSLSWLGKYDEAAKCLDKAKQLNPNDYNLYVVMGNTYYFRKLYEEAISYYDTAISKNSKALNGFAGKGYSLYYLNRHTESIDAFKKALEIDPSNADTYYFISLALFKSGDTENYLTYLKTAITLDINYEYRARDEEAFKSLQTDEEFVKTVFDASKLINTLYKNPEILRSGVLSGIGFLEQDTLGNDPEDSSLAKAVKDLEDKLYNGNIYNKETAGNYHINKDSQYASDLIQFGRYIKGRMLVGLKTTYEITDQKIIYVGKQLGSTIAAVTKIDLIEKYDGQSSNVYAYKVFILNNGRWEFYGYLDPKDPSSNN